MPDYTTPVTATAGQPLPAADWNTSVRDNLTALGVAWTAYTPTWASTGAAPVLGNGTIAGRYRKFGKTLDLRITLTMGTTTTYGAIAWYFTTPSSLTGAGGGDQLLSLLYQNTSVAGYLGAATIAVGGSAIVLTVDTSAAGGGVTYPSATVPFAWGTGDIIILQGTIEIA